MNLATTGSCLPVHKDNLRLLADLRKYYARRFEPAKDCSTPNVLILKFVTRGEQRYEVANATLRIRPACFLLLNPGTALRQIPAGNQDHTTLDILFPSAMLDDLFKQTATPFPYLPGSLYEMTPFVQHAIQPFLQEKEIQDDEELLKAYLGISELLLYCQQLNASRVYAIKAARMETREELFVRLQQASAYILSHYESISSIDEIAKACSLSQSLLTKHYASVAGLSPKQHIIRLKLEHSKQLLQTTDLPVMDIVEQVGFINSSSFIRLFRSFTGMTPRHYRVKFGCDKSPGTSTGSLIQRLNRNPLFMV